jgi:DNA-binding MarR family transcriptional regulator
MAECDSGEAIEGALRRATAAHRLRLERALKPFGLTPIQFAILDILIRDPGMSAAELARAENLTPPTLSVIVGNLTRKGLIERRPDQANQRVQRLFASSSGEALASDCRGILRFVSDRLVEALPDGAQTAVRLWLLRLSRQGS